MKIRTLLYLALLAWGLPGFSQTLEYLTIQNLKSVCYAQRDMEIFSKDVAEYNGFTTELDRRMFKAQSNYQQKCEELERERDKYRSGFVLVRCDLVDMDFDSKTNRMVFKKLRTFNDTRSDDKKDAQLQTSLCKKNLFLTTWGCAVKIPTGYYKYEYQLKKPEQRTRRSYNPVTKRYEMTTVADMHNFTEYIYSGKLSDSEAWIAEKHKNRGRLGELIFVCTVKGNVDLGKVVLNPIAILFKSGEHIDDLTGSLKGEGYSRFATKYNRHSRVVEEQRRQAEAITAQMTAIKTAIETRGYALPEETSTPAYITVDIFEPTEPRPFKERIYKVRKRIGITDTSLSGEDNGVSGIINVKVDLGATINLPDGTTQNNAPVCCEGSLTEHCIQFLPEESTFKLKVAFDKNKQRWIVKNNKKLLEFLQSYELSEQEMQTVEDAIQNKPNATVTGFYKYSYDLSLKGAKVNGSNDLEYSTHKEFPVRVIIK